ncbi:MAG TPA: prepilin-type N-terminal cleavage/methylation domain-containing protein, partial [Cyclobacteriaceae bacterium]|nr:prepilin-type N-terminal cleavage/methylation domain-containing protein [Cyclobacteriaceae bacterium]
MGGRISSISGFSLTELTVTIAITSMMLSMAFGLPTYMGQHVSHMEGQMEHSELQLTLLNALSQKRSCTRLFSNVELDPEETASVPLNLQLPGFGSLTTGSH